MSLRILFLCGCLEPGKDGVGDYTRKIAGQLCKAGYNVHMIALNDPFVTEKQMQQQLDQDITITSLRFPVSYPMAEKVAYARQHSIAFKPQWISLQYVPYAFHPKGLPFTWVKQFKRCAPDARWHVMMHELWIGSKKTDSWKDKIVGHFQREIVRGTLNNICPVEVTSSLEYYRMLCKTIGYKISILPVFNNIGCGVAGNQVLLQQVLPQLPPLGSYIIGVLFGGLHADAEVYENVATLIQKAANEQREIVFVHVGRSAAIASFFDVINRQYNAICISLGEQTPVDIASLFNMANFGISTYSIAFLGKSGSVAAMLNNKLPVVLLKEPEIETPEKYKYAEHVTEIPFLSRFINQSKDWSSIYGLENATGFYHKIFNN